MENTIRKRQKKRYTQVSNMVLNDENLSLKAKGLYAFMDSKPEGWNFTIKSISTQVKDGIDSVKSALKELKNAGYIQYRKLSNGTGIYELFDEPKVENQTAKSGKPSCGKPSCGKSTRINNTNIENKLIRDNRHTDIDFKVLIAKLREKAHFKSKIKNTDEEYEAYLDIENKSNILSDYLDHQREEQKYSKNFHNFLLDYNTKSLSEQVSDVEVRLWS
ncbi:hypothetical protein PF327_10885 [Sulfurovum sp. XTW-4]|uniref:Helix-turn-helix domain-containing protein n=1 Tax=Sulfurovum xiamenensis TaxID=3019066 RepID=A0ABT7QUE0_9BACT|nr:helix-turn-helix domain-containing protein [Sulfurovum xiamenensis]MDM5264700.1 hypothetical protein [Sulfurovum xiamenensis]